MMGYVDIMYCGQLHVLIVNQTEVVSRRADRSMVRWAGRVLTSVGCACRVHRSVSNIETERPMPVWWWISYVNIFAPFWSWYSYLFWSNVRVVWPQHGLISKALKVLCLCQALLSSEIMRTIFCESCRDSRIYLLDINLNGHLPFSPFWPFSSLVRWLRAVITHPDCWLFEPTFRV